MTRRLKCCRGAKIRRGYLCSSGNAERWLELSPHAELCDNGVRMMVAMPHLPSMGRRNGWECTECGYIGCLPEEEEEGEC